MWVEGKRGQKRIKRDLKIDLAMKGDIQRRAVELPLPDNAPGFQANGDFSGEIPAPLRPAQELAAPPGYLLPGRAPAVTMDVVSWPGPPLSPALSPGADPSCLHALPGPRPLRTSPPWLHPRSQQPGPGLLADLVPLALHLWPCLTISGVKGSVWGIPWRSTG